MPHLRRLHWLCAAELAAHLTSHAEVYIFLNYGLRDSLDAPAVSVACSWAGSAPSITCRSIYILGSMVSHSRIIVGLSQSASAVGWGSPFHAWLASVNWISGARRLNRSYRYGARGMHYHILLRQYSQNCYTSNSVVKKTYSPCHKDACVQIQ